MCVCVCFISEDEERAKVIDVNEERQMALRDGIEKDKLLIDTESSNVAADCIFGTSPNATC